MTFIYFLFLSRERVKLKSYERREEKNTVYFVEQTTRINTQHL